MLRTRRLAVCRVTTANVPSAAMIFPFARDVIKGARGTSESHGCGNFRIIEKKRASSKTKSADWVQIQFGTSIAKFEVGDLALSPDFRRMKGIMRIVHLKITGVMVSVLTLFAMIFLVSGAAQTDVVKFTDAASYYKDAKCVVCHGQKAEKKFDAEIKEEDLVQIVLKGKKPEKPPNMPAYETKGLT